MPTPISIESRAEEALAHFSPARRYLIGVSGGRDSAALLHLLAGLGYRKLIVCHLDHHLRRRASRMDARFVECLGEQYGFEAVVDKVNVQQLAKEQKLSIETAARTARYEFFARVAREKKCRTIFLAHHADDQVETFLFNLFRGAGASGLGAMRVESRRDGLRIVRPLLGIWRNEIDDFVKRHRLKFREDASNAETKHTRNRMRHEIIPSLEKSFGREIKKSIWRSADILAAENDWIESLIDKPALELSVAALRAMPTAQQRRMILAWLRSRRVADAGFFEVEKVRELIPVPATKAKVNLPGDLHARRRAGKLFVE